MEDDKQVASSSTTGSEYFEQKQKRDEEEEDRECCCEFCHFWFLRLIMTGRFCSAECALGFTKEAADMYNAYYSLALSMVQPSQMAYCPKPAVAPEEGESHSEYSQRVIRVLYGNSRNYEIDQYRNALFKESVYLDKEDTESKKNRKWAK